MISIIVAFQLAAASASGATSTDSAVAPCALQLAPTQTPFAGDVMFVCWSRAVPLGKADRFSSGYNSSTRSTAVVLETARRRRVLLISPTADNSPVVEDITRDLAKLAGRYADAGLDGLDIDLSRFAGEGIVSVSNGRPAGRAPADGPIGGSLAVLDSVKVLDAKPFAMRAASISDAFAMPPNAATERLSQ